MPTVRAATPPARRPRRALLLSLFAGFAVFAYVFDQLTKLWVTGTMTEGERIPVLPPAAALVLHPQLGCRVLHRRERHLGLHHHHGGRVRRDPAAASQTRLSLVGAGAGPAAGRRPGQPDRPPLPRALVRDGPRSGLHPVPNFAIFNIADSAVVSSVVLICLLTLRGIGLDGSRHNRAPTRQDKAAAGRQRWRERTGTQCLRRCRDRTWDRTVNTALHFTVPEELAGTRVDAGWRNSWTSPVRRRPR